MFCYISELRSKDNENKLNYILKKKNIKFSMVEDFIKITVKKNILEYSLYYDNLKIPQYLISNIDNDSPKIRKIYENINNKIDEYNSLDSIILEINFKLNTLEQLEFEEKKNNDIQINKIKKTQVEFEKELDEVKEKYISENNTNSKINSGLKIFSLRTNVEMLGDQILKLHLDSRFNVKINNFPHIQIKLYEFTFIGSNGLIITIDMDMSSLNLLLESPKIKINSNKILKDNILKVISELKPFSDKKSWSVKYSISETVENIFNMINTYGEIEQEFSSELEQIINDLEYLVSIKNQNISDIKLLELFDKELLINSNTKNSEKTQNQSNISKTSNPSGTKTYWKQGTGYGNDKTKKWDIDQYIKNVNEKKNKISQYYCNFILKLSGEYPGKNKLTSISDNILNRIINLLVNYLQNEEVSKSNILLIVQLVDDNIEVLGSIKNFILLFKLTQTYLEDNEIEHNLNNKIELLDVNKILLETKSIVKKDIFIEMFEPESFKMYSGDFSGFYYKDQVNINSDKLTRLKKEFNIMKKSISINSEASMFFWVEKNKLEKMRFIITGPADTPYEQGLYIFDMTLSNEFPTKPPQVHFSNNGGVRFNPNLYNCGKVCLSLLGTWRGDKGESWNSTTSTFFQILVSIQSQILIDEPFFNEPGYEKQIGTQTGIKNSKDYNDNIRQYNLDYAINGLIEGVLESKSSYGEFENIIRNYFKYKRDRIIGILNKWEKGFTDDIRKKKFITSKNKFLELSYKL
jgi:ubiquitin-protein ligase